MTTEREQRPPKGFKFIRLPHETRLSADPRKIGVGEPYTVAGNTFMVIVKEPKTYLIRVVLWDGRVRQDRLHFGGAYEILDYKPKEPDAQFRVSKIKNNYYINTNIRPEISAEPYPSLPFALA